MTPRQAVLSAGVLAGFAILAALCAWQVDRALERERNIQLAAERLSLPPVPLPGTFSPVDQELMPVFVRGTFDHDGERHILTSLRPFGPGVRVITPLETVGGRRILVDRGFVPERLRERSSRPEGLVSGTVNIEGVLSWPRERGFFVPEPDSETGLWFARDVAALSIAAAAEDVLVIARHSAPGGHPGPTRRDRTAETSTWSMLPPGRRSQSPGSSSGGCCGAGSGQAAGTAVPLEAGEW